MTVEVVDNSIMASMATCETWAMLRYGLGMAPADDDERAPLKAGTAVHAALGAYLGGGTRAMALRALSESYEAWATEHVPDNDRLGYANVATVVSRWMDVYPPAAWPFRVAGPEWIERPIRVPLYDGVDFVVRLDGLAQTPDGTYWGVEIKTTGRMDERWRRRWRMSSQITGYTWAVREAFGKPVAGFYVVGLELGKLPSDPKRKCKDHGVAYAECGLLHARFDIVIEPRAPQTIRSWHSSAVGLAKKFLEGKRAMAASETVWSDVAQEGMFTGACGDCAAQDWCALGRRPEHVGVMFEHNPWDPASHAGVPK